MLKFERLVAWRYLRSRRQEGFISVITFLSLLGICLGVATLIIVMSVMNGFRGELFKKILGFNGHLFVMETNQYPITDYANLAEQFSKLPSIVAATPMIENGAMVTSEYNIDFARIRGIRLTDLKKRSFINDNIIIGSIEQFERQGGAVIGYKLANRLGLSVGDFITLISPQNRDTVIGNVPRIKSYPIVAVFNVGMSQYDSNFVLIPLEAAQLYFSRNQQVDYIEIVTDNADEVGQPKREIQQYLHAHNLNYQIESWQERYGEFLGVLDVEKTVMFIILFLIIIVASFNIISSQIMMVKDKRQEIGILRTLGATKRSILSIFLINGASTGILGVGTGFILGVLFVENIERIRQWVQSILGTELFPDTFYFLSQLPAVLDWKQVLLIVGVAFGLSLLASLYPAWRAARLDPVQVLRYE